MSVDVPDSASGGSDRLTFTAAFAGAEGSDATCEHTLSEDVTPTLASLVAAEAQPSRVHVEWLTSTETTVTVQRSTSGSRWEALRTAYPEQGRVAYDDRSVEPGRRYGYRLSWLHPGGEVVAGEVWLEVPRGTAFALHGLRPNPAAADLAVAFSLPAGGPVALELYDVTGRKVMDRRMTMGAGSHVLPLPFAAGLAPGVYVVRLTFGGRTLQARGVIIR